MIPRYRAWNKKCNEMFKDTFAITESGQVIIVEQESVFDNPDYVFTDDLIIMQSTGLTDKKDKEIFEGDVVTDGQTVGDIKHHQTYGFYMIDDKGIERFFSDGSCIEDFEEDAETISEILEIIGNIYENPELLEERL